MPKGTQIINEDGSEFDLAKDSTSQEILDTVGQESGATVLSRLLDIWNKLVELFNTGAAKIKLWDGTNIAAVLDLDVNRLAVDVNQEGGVALQRFTLDIAYDTSGISLNTATDTILKSVNGNGRLDFVSIDCGSSTYEVAIEIDGVEVLRISMADLGSNLGLANATNVPIWVETANKNFRLSPNTEAMDFTTNFTIKAKALVGTPSVTWLTKHRNLV